MDILNVESNETVSREQAAGRLRAIADSLASSEDRALEWGDKHVRLRVADEVRLEIEIEVGEDETELEIELKWSR